VTEGKPEMGQTEHVSQADRGKVIQGGPWPGAATRDSREALPEPSSRSAELARRARHYADLARRVLEPAEPSEQASLQAAASELYRQSAYWALCALAAGAGGVAGSHYDDSVWDTADEALLAQVAPGSEGSARLRALLRAGSFVYFGELPQAASASACSELQRLSGLLCRQLNGRARSAQVKQLKRSAALGALALVLLAGIAVTLHFRNAHELMVGKPWKASSLNGAGCTSPAQRCAQSPSFFFHTNEEENPWLEFDLGATQRLSRAAIENRRDCCSDRAVPLELEVSTDHKNWQTVARQAEDFTTWNVAFDSVEARWVRLQTHRRTYLHLAEVRIWP
jgi:hypothetical protein